jgi:hypothetical protein
MSADALTVGLPCVCDMRQPGTSTDVRWCAENVRLDAVFAHVPLRSVRGNDHGWQTRVSDVPQSDRKGDACVLLSRPARARDFRAHVYS